MRLEPRDPVGLLPGIARALFFAAIAILVYAMIAALSGCVDRQLRRDYEAQVRATEAITRAQLCSSACRVEALCDPPTGSVLDILSRIDAEVAALCPCIPEELCTYLMEVEP